MMARVATNLSEAKAKRNDSETPRKPGCHNNAPVARPRTDENEGDTWAKHTFSREVEEPSLKGGV